MSSEEKKEKLAKVTSSKKFHWSFTALGIFFIILTFFIAAKPEGFIKYGYFGVFVFNIIGSGLLLFPILSTKFSIILLILFSALGNVINTSVSYFVGYAGRDHLPKYKIVDKTKNLVERFGLFMVYILAVTPLPLDVAALLSGYVRIPYKKYLLVNFLGKITVFSLVGWGIISLFHH